MLRIRIEPGSSAFQTPGFGISFDPRTPFYISERLVTILGKYTSILCQLDQIFFCTCTAPVQKHTNFPHDLLLLLFKNLKTLQIEKNFLGGILNK